MSDSRQTDSDPPAVEPQARRRRRAEDRAAARRTRCPTALRRARAPAAVADRQWAAVARRQPGAGRRRRRRRTLRPRGQANRLGRQERRDAELRPDRQVAEGAPRHSRGGARPRRRRRHAQGAAEMKTAGGAARDLGGAPRPDQRPHRQLERDQGSPRQARRPLRPRERRATRRSRRSAWTSWRSARRHPSSRRPPPPTRPKPAPPAAKLTAVSDEDTGSIQRPRLPGYWLVDVEDGYALIDGRDGPRQIAPGDFLPGAGRVQRIERRGRDWVVVTSAGVIAGDQSPLLNAKRRMRTTMSTPAISQPAGGGGSLREREAAVGNVDAARRSPR